MSDTSNHLPGDAANGYILGSDNQWHAAPPPQGSPVDVAVDGGADDGDRRIGMWLVAGIIGFFLLAVLVVVGAGMVWLVGGGSGDATTSGAQDFAEFAGQANSELSSAERVQLCQVLETMPGEARAAFIEGLDGGSDVDPSAVWTAFVNELDC